MADVAKAAVLKELPVSTRLRRIPLTLKLAQTAFETLLRSFPSESDEPKVIRAVLSLIREVIPDAETLVDSEAK